MGSIGYSKKGQALTSLIKTVTLKGTQERLSATNFDVKLAIIQALESNTGNVVIAASNADVATGLGTVLIPLGVMTLDGEDLYNWWIDGETGEGVSITYVKALKLS